MKLNKNSAFRAVGLSSFFVLLALIGMAVFCPTASESASAATRGTLKLDFVLREALQRLSIDFFLSSGGGIDYTSIAKELNIDFEIKSALTIAMSDLENVTGSKTTSQPVAGATFFSGSTNFSVESSASNGFSVYVYGKDSQTAMKGATSGNTTTIPTLTSTGSVTTAGNWWGYDLDLASNVPADATSITYNGVSATKSTAAYASNDGSKKNLKLTFGTKVDMATLTPDTYSGTVTVNAVPGATQVSSHNAAMMKIERAVDEELTRRADEQGITVDELLENARREQAERQMQEAAEQI